MPTLIDLRQEGEKSRPRHPEKEGRPENASPRKPDWIRVKAPTSLGYHQTKELVRDLKLHTVCEEAGCPNIGECWSQKHATFMILGGICTRACSFCNVATGKPLALDQNEPENVAYATAQMGLKHVVVTSVDRDDLEDGGADHFVRTIQAIRRSAPATTIEILTPDFLRKPGAAELVIDAKPDVFNHNLETVPRLYHSIRPGARYYQSLRLLDSVKQRDPSQFTKSGLMVGLGEAKDEVLQVMDDLRVAGVDFLTIGQYLQPTKKHAAIDRFWTPEEFKALETIAYAKGFLMVSASPLTRSSHHAGEDFARLKAARFGANFSLSMARTIIEAERILPYAPDDLCRLVGDVRVYPKFVPFLKTMRIMKEEPREEGGWEGIAEADVGWQAIKVTFSTHVRCEPAKGEVEVALVKGPLHSLANRWWFKPHETGAHVRYWIAYEFKNPVLQAAISANKDKLAGRIMTAFENEARRRLSKRSSG